MTDVLQVRPIEDADVGAVVALWKASGSLRPWNDPRADIARARAAENAEVLVGLFDGAMVAAVMVGDDGHRGWVYYLATQPEQRNQGHGATMMHHAEAWLRHRGCPKIEVMIRSENEAVREFYTALDYRQEPRAVMSKWLIEPPAPQVEVMATETADASEQELEVTVTWLEMTARPTRPPVPPPLLEQPLSLLRLEHPTVSYWRYLYDTVGEPWFWWEQRRLSPPELAEIIQDPLMETYVLSVGNSPAGFIQLDRRDAAQAVDLSYFGLVPEFIGRGLGAYLLDWGIRAAWDREPHPPKLTVNTCTLDHPAALTTYQRAGFVPVRQKTVTGADPRRLGYLPADLPLPAHFDAVAKPGGRP